MTLKARKITVHENVPAGQLEYLEILLLMNSVQAAPMALSYLYIGNSP